MSIAVVSCSTIYAKNVDRFGASLSYASSDGQSAAASSQVLRDSMIEDSTEIILLSDRSCSDGECGYTRPGGVAFRMLTIISSDGIS